MKFGFAGYYRLIKHKADSDGNVIDGTSEVVLDWFKNLITNSGLDQQSNQLVTDGYDGLRFCRIGTGNTAPSFTDTQLVAQTASTSTAGAVAAVGVGPDNTYIYRRVSRRFAAGSAAGVNLAEVAMAGAATGDVFSRALLTDSEGSPTTINLSPDEVLDVVYELRIYIDDSDVAVPATIDGAPATVTIRTHGWPNSTQWVNGADNIGRGVCSRYWTVPTENPTAQASVPAGGAGTQVTWSAYVPGTFRRTTTRVFGLTEANFATGIGAVGLCLSPGSNPAWSRGTAGCWTFNFSPKLNKNNARTATVTIGLEWGRHEP